MIAAGAPLLVDNCMLLDKLRDWIEGRIGAAEIKSWADSARPSDKAGPAVRTALADLDLLEVHLLTAEDAPALLRLVESADPASAELAWSGYRSAIDLDSRSRLLRKDPLYRDFCR